MSAQSLADKQSSPSRRDGVNVAVHPLDAISNAIVRLYKEAFGRGPAKVRTRLAGPDAVLVLLENALTVTERTLIALDKIDAPRDSRLVVQEALGERARSVVEQALSRRVLAVITGVDFRQGVAVNVFTLEPAVDEERRQDGAALRSRLAR